jgi:hypothetical protein
VPPPPPTRDAALIQTWFSGGQGKQFNPLLGGPTATATPRLSAFESSVRHVTGPVLSSNATDYDALLLLRYGMHACVTALLKSKGRLDEATASVAALLTVLWQEYPEPYAALNRSREYCSLLATNAASHTTGGKGGPLSALAHKVITAEQVAYAAVAAHASGAASGGIPDAMRKSIVLAGLPPKHRPEVLHRAGGPDTDFPAFVVAVQSLAAELTAGE